MSAPFYVPPEQLYQERAEYARKGISRGKPIVALEFNQGVVLMAVDGKVVFERAYGKANYEFDVNNSIDTRFQIASVSKAFTAAATILLLDSSLATSVST